MPEPSPAIKTTCRLAAKDSLEARRPPSSRGSKSPMIRAGADIQSEKEEFEGYERAILDGGVVLISAQFWRV